MTDLQKQNLSFIADNIESSPTPHALASAVRCIANVLLSSDVDQPAAPDVGPAVVENVAAQLQQPDAVSEADRAGLVVRMRDFADKIEQGSADALRAVEHMARVMGSEAFAVVTGR